MFLDTTCLKANIHFPVDWVLLCDGVKSLMQSVEVVRSHGLKSRMCEPQEFITKINRLSMEMTHTRRKKNGNKERKRVLREMKRIVTVVRAHAQRYYTLLDENWQATDWTRPQAEQVLKRIKSIIEALPAAVKQAHERIIGERQVANDEKILSLFEPDIHGSESLLGSDLKIRGNTLTFVQEKGMEKMRWLGHFELRFLGPGIT
jgi:hypothetical protein